MMAGIYIPCMEMPASCADCRFYGEYCYAKGDENKRSKLPCPLIPVPDHGRLIDADAAKKAGWTICRIYSDSPTTNVYEAKAMDYLPTIIPGEEAQA